MTASINFGDNTEEYYYSSSGLVIDPSTEDHTLLIWAYHTNVSTEKDQMIYYWGTSGGQDGIFLNTTGGYSGWVLYGSFNSLTAISADTWYFLALTYVGSSGAVEFFLNGVSDITDTGSTAFGNEELIIGRHRSIANRNMEGNLAFPLLFDRVLDINEINEIMHNPYSIPGGLMYAPDFLSVVATTVIDLSPNNITVVDTGSPTISKEGPPVHFPQMQG